MNTYNDNATAISAVLSDYFRGVFNGDVTLLEHIFHPQALVSGDINGQEYFKTLEQYLNGVKNRKSPHTLGETFRMEILSIEIINAIAVAKVHLPMFEFNYYDLLSLSKVGGQWVIVNKLLTNVNL
ncbi:nuclear transport factor 2 family protein [Dyadobacter subterraneus]|uniref:Nuclear transport factor 2 family protein n=1 Tax=Dyadobacter subterraneus TaxID=2773304 RepID=A0ABR9WCZ3_9BACT|nr:nuclear transport factor 2 family protein [Dyadobacter subterraneus]MBE9463357.1 nuclear transport factor 2 family protein [Dyadobacter subterraneus]